MVRCRRANAVRPTTADTDVWQHRFNVMPLFGRQEQWRKLHPLTGRAFAFDPWRNERFVKLIVSFVYRRFRATMQSRAISAEGDVPGSESGIEVLVGILVGHDG